MGWDGMGWDIANKKTPSQGEHSRPMDRDGIDRVIHFEDVGDYVGRGDGEQRCDLKTEHGGVEWGGEGGAGLG